MKTLKPSSTRLWVILARKAPVAVIFRRGPSRQVQMIKWHLDDDMFEYGQWFKGRIYERRCDLSPNGTLLIYFAATYKAPLHSWTAVSKPPWFTAVALWPKGDGWNGGGHFVGPHDIHLDHFPNEDVPHTDFETNCRKLRIVSGAGWRGEDAPVWHTTMERGGWTRVTEGIWSEYGRVKGYSWKASVPEEWRRPHPKLPLALQMLIEGIKRENGPWYVTRYRVIDKCGMVLSDLGAADWAEWDSKGNLLFARDGCLFRQTVHKGEPAMPVLLADFRHRRFTAVAPPNWAITL